ncbi:hypothetical protein V1525DRAFT_423797 [Lipomyces kononenkoae]|uniref:Uncharacterized protein n=1 Tax=Lipomyces kononenkoae TaxID=34357 RepID=A0ACC3T9A7_LIPKO
MEHSELLEIVRRPLSPDTVLEVPASQSQYDLVQETLENEDARYPQLWYDSDRSIAIITAAPSPLHSDMSGALPGSIFREVIRSKISSDIANGLSLVTERTSSRGTNSGRTKRAWDGVVLIYLEGTRRTLMISLEVGVSQSYSSLRASISWSICALEIPPIRYYASNEEIDRVVMEAEGAFRDQLIHHPYGPLESNGFIWFGRVQQSIVDSGQYVAQDISPNIRDVVLEDCIPTHILSSRVLQETPVNFSVVSGSKLAFRDPCSKPLF